MPWLFGTPRVAPNLIQHDDFTPVAHTENQQAGGKGGGGGSTSTTTYTYTAAIIMALCRGPILGVGRIWIGKEQKSAQQLNLDVYGGSSNQTPHPHWLTKHSSSALAYRNMAYAASAKYDLGDNGEVPSHNFEIFTPTRISSTQPDANPAVIIQELISNKVDGLGIDVSKIANLQLFSDFCMANGIWISPCYDEQQAAHELITRIAEIGHSAVVVSEGKVKLIPYADTYASGNGASFTPNNAPVYDLTEDDFLPNGGQPIKMTRSSQADADNHFQITYYDRNSEYNEATAEAQDQAHIEKFGLRTKEPEEYHEICDGAVAQKLVNFKKDRSLSIRTTYEFQLSMRYALLEPMDIVTLTLAQDGLDHVPVRITEIEEDDDGNLSIKAEDCPLGSQSPTQQIAQTSLAGTIDFNVNAGNINAPVIFEPSLQLTRGSTEIWAAVSGGQNWGGAQVWVSLDNQTYQKVGTVNAPSRQGVLTAPLAAGSAIDTANVLKISTDMSRGALLSATEQEALDLITLCYADGELLSYKDAQLTGVNTYDLSYLVRGLYGTEITAHNAGTKFARLDEATFKYPYKPEWVGKTVYLKFVSYNRYGAGEQSLADVVAYPYTIVGAPLKPVGNLAFEKPWVGSDVKLRWDLVEGAERYEVQVYAGMPIALVRQISTVTEGRFTYTLDMARQDGGTWRTIIFKVRPISITGNVGQWSQLMATNPQIGALSGFKFTQGLLQSYLEYAKPADSDFAGVMVWLGTTAGFIPNSSSLVYDGDASLLTLNKQPGGAPLDGGATYFVRVAGYDQFGKDELNVSASMAFEVYSVSAMAKDLSESNLAQSLKTRVDLIDGAGAGSVTARISTEASARTAAIAAEVSNRANALSAESAARGAAITTEKSERVAADGVLTSQINTVSATVNANNTSQTAALQSEQTARINGDGVLTTQFNNLSASVDSIKSSSLISIKGASSLTEWSNASGSAELFAGSDASTKGGYVLRAGNNAGDDQFWGIHKSNIKISDDLIKITTRWRRVSGAGGVYIGLAGVAINGTSLVSVSGIDSTVNQHYTTINAKPVLGEWQTTVGYLQRGGTGSGLSVSSPRSLHANVAFVRPIFIGNYANLAGVVELDYFKTELLSDSAMAAISQVEATSASATAAQASQINTLQTTVNSNTASIQAQNTSINGLSAQYTVKTDVNGYVAGYGLATTASNGTPQSAFIINADKFGVSAAGKGTSYPFVVDTAKNIVGVNGALTVDGTLSGRAFVAETVTSRELAADSVGANHLQAVSVGAKHLMVGASSNMLVNAGFESDFYGWNLFKFWDNAGRFTGFNLSDDYRLQGVSNKCFAINFVPSGNATDCTLYQDVACEPNATYIASAYSGAHRCEVGVSLGFMDANNNWLASSNVLQTSSKNISEADGGRFLKDYKRIFYRSKAPLGAVKMRVEYFKRKTLGSFADSWMFITRPYIGECLPNQAEVPPWDAAGATVIGPGNIKTDNLSAISANLGSINAGSLNINNRFIVNSDGSTLICSGTGGQRTEIDNQQFRAYDANGVLRVRLGVW